MDRISGDDRYRPRYGPDRYRGVDTGPRVLKDGYHFTGSHAKQHAREIQSDNFTSRRKERKNAISNRPLLTTRRPPSPDGVLRYAQSGHRFRQPDHLTDSEEEDMDLSQSETDNANPPAKRARTGPAWSNPDPYTALPPIIETPRRKRDVVKLIRKSRVISPTTDLANGPMVSGQDFISLDLGEDHPNWESSHFGQTTKSQQLGKRKRDEMKDCHKFTPASSKVSRLHQRGKMLPNWAGDEEHLSAPWYRSPASSNLWGGVALHREILDFYEWVKPQEYEHEIRMDVVHRLQKTFSKLEPGCRLEPFGSFAAGLYLPTGDLDLVLITRGYSGSRFARSAKNLFWSIHDKLRREQIAAPGSLQPISKAKVPIIKFVDAFTGLKVDLSFNNETGIIANKTFHVWRERYPAMPILVAVVKQYLMMRGLNDVASGGLGGFSIICLVTNLLQHHIPSAPVPNLGELLLHFFHLYGTVFNKRDLAIRLEPPGYVRKELYLPFRHNSDKPTRLAIIDPNKADNNISGGSAEIDLIFDCFAQAFRDLEAQLSGHERARSHPRSILLDLIGGDYQSYEAQRERLQRIYGNRTSAVS